MNEINNERKLLIALREGAIPSERSGEYWSKEEKENLQRMFWNGDGISDIALSLQRSENAIIQQLIILKMLTPPGAARERNCRGEKKCPRSNTKCPNNCGGYCYAGDLG